MAKKNDKLDRKLKITLMERDYIIEVPTVGQYLDIESRKMMLSGGNYNSMINSMTKTAVLALDIIDATALLMVLAPQFQEDLKAESLINLDMADVLPIIKLYNEEIRPWYQKWSELFQNATQLVKDKKKKVEDEK
jgi:hypothetical protein